MADLKEELKKFADFRESGQYGRFKERPIAYFCAEYALDKCRPMYSGGLGVLAGDVVREAADQNLPMVAVGLFYRNGYVCPPKEVGGRRIEMCDNHEPQDYGFVRAKDDHDEDVYVLVPIQDRMIKVAVWQKNDAGISFYALDTNCEENAPQDRSITGRLYVGDKVMRLKQEIILGIGGMRALEAMEIHPSVYHLNEGHSALLAYELIHHQMHERHLGFDEAKQYARRRIVMTNHTLVAAGNEIYSYDLVAMMLQRYAESLSVPVHDLITMGLVQESNEFSLSMLAFRMASVVNAVSKLHAAKAKEIWHNHPMVGITNGVHIPFWDQVGDEKAVHGEFWKAHQEKKRQLLALVKEKTGKEWGEDDLIIGWARRIVTYKRPTAMFEEAERLSEICRRSDRPVRILFSGHPHPSDDRGADLVKELIDRSNGEQSDIMAYLEDYSMDSAKLMISGCDVWLNTPIVGYEACGTSGMKAALNGVLTCSTQDGWVAEADMTHAGWILGNDFIGGGLCDKIEAEIAPMYFERNADGVPEVWEEYMLRSREMILDSFTATRMLREYLDMLYV